MNFLVISSAPVFNKNNFKESYLPLVNEMDIWFRHSDKVSVLAPNNYPDKVFTKRFFRDDIYLFRIPLLDFRNLNSAISSFLKIPVIFFQVIRAFMWADHIHFRCPGNVSLLGLITAIIFPSKPKTVKYAGNWDPKSNQPSSYKLQKWLLNNKSIIRNKKVLVYGKWNNQPEHIISFFTASFSESKKNDYRKRIWRPIKFIFCGNLVSGKNPMIAINIVSRLLKNGNNVVLEIYGDGPEKEKLESFISNDGLKDWIKLYGNVNQDVLIKAYIESHFCILPSKSEGWPKAIAEGMFFGCVPISKRISCVPWMLADGERGILFDEDINQLVQKIELLLQDREKYNIMSKNARNWSQNYTLEKFEKAIVKFL